MRVAIVGAGLMGRWHAHYAARAGADVVALVDPDPTALETLGRLYPRSLRFSRLDSCLAEARPAVVHVCTPPGDHVPSTEAALAAGAHVLVEKPLAPNAAATDRLLEAASERELLLAAVHQFPFQPGFRRLLARRASLGDLVDVSFVTCSAGGTRRLPAERRTLLFEILVHPLSLFRALLGVGVEGIRWQTTLLTDDELALAGASDGVSLRARISLRGRPTRNELSVIGDRATAHVDLFHGFSVVEAGAPSRRTKVLQPFTSGGGRIAAAGSNLVARAARRAYAYPGLAELIAAFHAAAGDGAPAPVSPAELRDIAAAVDRLRA
ncbi:MAG: Gfo/Idh/MocA family oxidoreductase [Actinomycetota bacterium]|nr:Gfo/Idh/MocA family oxidoreductase [Actinomycetota bacterium]